MWQLLRRSRRADADFVSSATELLRSTFRNLVLITGSVYLAWQFLLADEMRQPLGLAFFPVTLIVVPTCAIALRLLRRSLLAAQFAWQIGLTASIALAAYVTQEPSVAFLFALLPLMAVVTVGWRAALLMEGLVTAMVWGLFTLRGMPALPPSYGATIIIGGAFTGLLGWSAMQALLTAVEWSLVSSDQALAKMEEARHHRAEAVRLLKELDQAYYRLERANHMLILARADAEEAREARNRFVLAVSHELRTPLNFIIGFSDLMANSPETYADLDQWPPGLYEDTQEIYRSSTHLLRLVNDVLDLGQIEALRMALIKEWANPGQIVQEVEAMVQSAFMRKGLSFRTEVEPDLPDVFVDRTRIRQILLNLVSNGLRVTQRGGVTVRLRREGKDLLFQVEDTGPGIAKADISKVFEEFRQVGDGSWRRREGAGLGIPISRRFVELHGGQMRVESQVGKGTSFYFTLPISGAARDLSLHSDREADADYWRYLREKAMGQKMLVVISPDPAAGEVIARYTDGCGVVTVQNPEQVGDRVAELLPSALILDDVMSHDEHVQSALRDLPYDLPVVSFTFPGSPGHPRNLPAGVSGYLVKPIGRQALVESVRALGTDVSRLLVVDDDPGMVRFVTRVLGSTERTRASGNGYQLTSAFTGTQALERLREDPPDAMLLDLALPDISGWDVLSEVQKDPRLKDMSVIIITAYDWPQMTVTREQEALRVTMRRPLSRSELTPILNCLLETIQPARPTLSAAPARPTSPAG